MKFYTGLGDKGTSTLLGSAKRITKTDLRFEAMGALDELNSYLGICRSLAKEKSVKNAMLQAQENLFIIQAELGNAKLSEVEPPIVGGSTSDFKAKIQNLEKTIDEFGNAIGPITKFTIPGGSPLSTHLDYARAICRRAERNVIALNDEIASRHYRQRADSPISSCAAAYLNRLSSLLFVLARYANKKARIREKNPGYR